MINCNNHFQKFELLSTPATLTAETKTTTTTAEEEEAAAKLHENHFKSGVSKGSIISKRITSGLVKENEKHMSSWQR